MSYELDFVLQRVPASDSEASELLTKLREQAGIGDDEDAAAAPEFLTLVSALSSRYPCGCDRDATGACEEKCPWRDGLSELNFSSRIGILLINPQMASELIPFVVAESNSLGITVFDWESEKVHRPGQVTIHPKRIPQVVSERRPWWRPW